jgi:hypothetical protein
MSRVKENHGTHGIRGNQLVKTYSGIVSQAANATTRRLNQFAELDRFRFFRAFRGSSLRADKDVDNVKPSRLGSAASMGCHATMRIPCEYCTHGTA